MKSVFVDTQYWLAALAPNDQWGPNAKEARAKLGSVRLVTTDEVLTEFLNSIGRFGKCLRVVAAKAVRAILKDPNITVLPQTRAAFLDGLATYESRTDKAYSLTDCISMDAMKTAGITEVLTNDHHFEQEGFAVLIKKVQ